MSKLKCAAVVLRHHFSMSGLDCDRATDGKGGALHFTTGEPSSLVLDARVYTRLSNAPVSDCRWLKSTPSASSRTCRPSCTSMTASSV